MNTWENEEDKKRDLFKRLVEIDKVAQKNIYKMRGKDEADNNLYHVWNLLISLVNSLSH